MALFEDGLLIVYGLLFAFAVYVWFQLLKAMGEFKFKVMRRLFELMLISDTYVAMWLFAETILRFTGLVKTGFFDLLTVVAVGLLLAVYFLITQTLNEHKQELTKYDSLYYRT